MFDFLELKVPPALLFLLIAGLMYEVASLLPMFAQVFELHTYVAVVVFTTGVIIGLAAVFQFRRQRTTVHPNHPERARVLVASGIYRYTRNPMYLGLLLVLSAWGIYLANVANIAALFLFIVYMNRFQIRPEERALQRMFPSEFLTYSAGVRRWL